MKKDRKTIISLVPGALGKKAYTAVNSFLESLDSNFRYSKLDSRFKDTIRNISLTTAIGLEGMTAAPVLIGIEKIAQGQYIYGSAGIVLGLIGRNFLYNESENLEATVRSK